MKQWFWSYGWKFVLALIVAALAMAFVIRLERQASGEAGVPSREREPGVRMTVTANATQVLANGNPAFG